MTEQKVLKLRKELRDRSLSDKIANDVSQFKLKQTFKPILPVLEDQKQKMQEMVQSQRRQTYDIKTEIRKQPLIIPLIKSLNNYPKIISFINGESDGSDLDNDEKHILKQIGKVDDTTLKILVDYYSEPEARSDIESYLTKDSGVSNESREIFENVFQANKDEMRQIFLEQDNRDKFLSYLAEINYQFDLNRKPYTTIKTVNPEFYNEIKELRKTKTGKGAFVKFLSSDPKELHNKLNLLIAEKQAGNNNVLNEASAVVDELRRMGAISINQCKQFYKQFN